LDQINERRKIARRAKTFERGNDAALAIQMRTDCIRNPNAADHECS
jgi:hypothetical protein